MSEMGETKGIFFSPLKFTDSTQRFMEFKLRSPYPGPTHILKPNSNMLCQSPFSSHIVEINLPPLSPHGNIVPPTKIHVFFFLIFPAELLLAMCTCSSPSRTSDPRSVFMLVPCACDEEAMVG